MRGAPACKRGPESEPGRAHGLLTVGWAGKRGVTLRLGTEAWTQVRPQRTATTTAAGQAVPTHNVGISSFNSSTDSGGRGRFIPNLPTRKLRHGQVQ